MKTICDNIQISWTRSSAVERCIHIANVGGSNPPESTSVIKINSMTILFFARLFYPHIGGVEKHVCKISKEFLKKNYKVIVVTERYQQNLKEKENYEGIEIYRIPVSENEFFKKFEIWFWMIRNIKLIKTADIVHCHDVFFWFFPFRFLFLRKKVYTTFHGYEGNNIPTKKAILMHKVAEKLSMGNICVGDFLKKWYGTKPSYVIYGGTEINTINNYVKTKYKSNITKFVFIGRLEEETGILVYLEALKILKEKKVNFSLVILGDGSLKKKAEDFCKLNNLKVEFRGFVKGINSFIAKSDFVFTSRYLGILESFAFKKLVFAVYNNEIKKDYLEISPFAEDISISGNYKKLFNQIMYYLSHNIEKNIKIDRGYTWINLHTWKEITNIYLRLWKI